MTIPDSSAGGVQDSAGPTQAVPPNPGIPAGEDDAGWQAREGHDSFILALQVIGGRVPHPNPRKP